MKTIIIITECRRYRFNYGETLQAVALNKVLSNLGFKCITASYENEKNDLKGWMLPNIKTYALRGIKFELFRHRHIVYPIFRSNKKEDFEKLIDKADVLFCGSDCIWYEKDYNDILFMFFPKKKIPKIAYAPSLRDSVVTDNMYEKRVSKWIGQIDHLSTRELDGSRIIEEISKRTCQTVLDPTLLLDKRIWDNMSGKRIIKESYIVLYIIGKSRELVPILTQVKKFYKNRRIIWIGMENNNGYPFGDVLIDIGPAEFISLIKYADAVITDSFHGTAFSIIYEKQMYSIKRIVNKRDIYDNDCRIKNVFDFLGIHNYYTKSDKIDFKGAEIDYQEVSKKLKKQRETSLDYIVNALKDEGLLKYGKNDRVC